MPLHNFTSGKVFIDDESKMQIWVLLRLRNSQRLSEGLHSTSLATPFQFHIRHTIVVIGVLFIFCYHAKSVFSLSLKLFQLKIDINGVVRALLPLYTPVVVIPFHPMEAVSVKHLFNQHTPESINMPTRVFEEQHRTA